jgi:hypothetical protein
MTPRIQVVCSDQARNGKTLLARVIADSHILAGREPTIFDADYPQGGIRFFLPERSRLVDLTDIAGQMAMIDTILGGPPRDYVIDMPARLTTKGFDLFEQIDFVTEARRAGYSTLVFYIIDRPFSSLRTARKVYHGGQLDQFVPVRNQAVGHVSDFGHVVNLYGEIAQYGELIIPVAERATIQCADQHGFSFASFMLNRYGYIPELPRAKLRQFLNGLFAQLRSFYGQVELQDLRRMGLV